METNTDTNSILISIKQLLGIDHDYTHFDTDVIIQINMAINIFLKWIFSFFINYALVFPHLPYGFLIGFLSTYLKV